MNPYENLPEKAFWRSAVANKSMFDIGGLWAPKFHIDQTTKTSTFGSCFAQHFGRALRERGFNWLDAEPAPREFKPSSAERFNFGLFSARTGNIYTTSLLLQWVEWALGVKTPPTEVWEKDGRFFDPFRPNIEPNGFESKEELLRSRDETIRALNHVIRRSELFVFTLGLTESWSNATGGYEYPICPGTIAGEFDENEHKFCAQDFETVNRNLTQVIEVIHRANGNLKFLLTVSPVPLTATNSGDHVVVATSASKAILRAATETARNKFEYVDYFPSFEIINSPVFKGTFFQPNQRQVHEAGVSFVMGNFFDALESAKSDDAPTAPETSTQDVVCEEELLAAFGQREAEK